MRVKWTIFAAGLFTLGLGATAQAKETQFWNLTANTITKFQLSAPGKNDWGADQVVNDSDYSVDPDERLKITDVATGVYDVKFRDQSGRSCIVPNVAIKQGAVFSIDEKSIKGCTK